MTNLVKLDNVDHAELTVAPRHGAAFGDQVNQLLALPTEFEQLQRDFPILFRRGERNDGHGGWYAVVLTGLDRDENLFLAGDRWTTRTIPLVQQRGAFAADAADADAVLVDLDDPRVGAADGEPLFLPHGGSAPYLRHVTGRLQALRRGYAAADPFFAALAAHDLIKPVTLDIAIADGLSYQVPDVHTVDPERLDALAGPALETLHRTGVLRAATMAAASLGNVSRLIELKRQAAA